ncbi:HprK-related kinase A [Alteromonas lipolytica]|uniref:HprK-related kinase A n=1 Tax=Alteromonas lipolytica TaxID=1856405 RepID=A0A1E8FDS3_9ALTE|nr:HprK-related kinase A [Alteromonas lipolytica]OFI34085.1 hypothetical protein BFC17_21295 [Alteromonas lipolytica]GGF65539.1 HPr kinase [Alteromonas lipolytica]
MLTINIDSGLCRYHIEGITQDAHRELSLLYDNGAKDESPEFADYFIRIDDTSFIRKFLRPQKVVKIEGQRPFNPVPPAKVLPSVEWAMNWCLAAFEHQKLVFHSSVVVKNGRAFIFPAVSGSGKTTLATYLGANGWHMFSDELAIVDLNTNSVNPLFRPSSLKNESIDVIKETCSDCHFSKITKNTHKGDIGHAKLYCFEKFKSFVKTPIEAVVFPKFKRGSDTNISILSKAEGFAAILRHNFNYDVLGVDGFKTLSLITQNSRFYYVEYSDLADMAALLDEILEGQC